MPAKPSNPKGSRTATHPRLLDAAVGIVIPSDVPASAKNFWGKIPAAVALAKVVSAAKESHADCLRIIARAQIRMADEADAAQSKGEIAIRGQHTAHAQGSAMSEIGLDSRRLAEWREMRDAGDIRHCRALAAHCGVLIGRS